MGCRAGLYVTAERFARVTTLEYARLPVPTVRRSSSALCLAGLILPAGLLCLFATSASRAYSRVFGQRFEQHEHRNSANASQHFKTSAAHIGERCEADYPCWPCAPPSASR